MTDRARLVAGLVAGLAHDLENHLGVIATSAHLARTSPERHLDRIAEQTRLAQALVSVVMGVARGEAIVRQVGPVKDVAARAIAASGAHGVVCSIADGVTVSAQPTLLVQALVNLVRNAVEAAGANGRITVAWNPGATPEEGAFVVEDDGPGFPEGFDLAVGFRTEKPGGTGLGLVVARAVAELHRGEVSVARIDGRTRVTLRVSGGA